MAESESRGTDPDLVETAREALARLGHDPGTLCDVQPLSGGLISIGAYRLTFLDGSTKVLKARHWQPGDPVCEGARREATFYRDLAPRAAIRTPEILGVLVDDQHGAFVLMADLSPTLPPAGWTDAMYLQAARDLGRFHAGFLGRAEELALHGFLPHRSLVITEQDVEHALGNWRFQSRQERFRDLLTPERLRFVEEGIATLGRTQSLLAAIPETLLHGDCHVGNILRDAHGELVWSDWSGVCLGRGPEDLSFLHQRAATEGGNVPFDRYVETYHVSLNEHLPEPVSLETIRMAVLASEWNVRLLQWPHYFDYMPAEGLAAFLDRLDEVATLVSAVRGGSGPDLAPPGR